MNKTIGNIRYSLVLVISFLYNVIATSTNLSDNTFKTINYVSFSETKNGFVVFSNGKASPILVDKDDHAGVLRVAGHLKDDIKLVTGVIPEIITENKVSGSNVIIIGTIGKSKLINELVESGKINIDDVKGKWEVSLIQVIDNPFPGIKKGLVIAGSDKRGTIFGMFDFSSQMGISPWYYWADVPVINKNEIYVKHGRYNLGEPKVQYRGIFINDEAPALTGWAFENFGGFNSKFYAHVFELILRLKGNFLWPAMWGRAIYDDDPKSPILADEYGVVLSTSHHEPMMRAHVEWSRYGKGPWNFNTNTDVLKDFWGEGIRRMGKNESIVTVGMRGDGDEPMSKDRNIEVLSKIVEVQRGIIENVTGKPAVETQQVWALYKEVQEYYDMGMRVPDDIMLLYCDDNWGNIRRVPGAKEKMRKGGTGMYYHFDYVGGPRNYKWINTNPLPKIWEQMKLSYENGIEKLWVVNVGDIKPMEFPIQFFLDLAWDPDRFGPNEVEEYTLLWSKQQFGENYAGEIAKLIAHYGKINSRRKPELLDWNTFSLVNYREFQRVADEYNSLTKKATQIYSRLNKEYHDAYYQLVLYPIEACANIYNLYHATAKNHFYAGQGRAMTNQLADSVRFYYNKDSIMTRFFHTSLANGKWNHIMSQTRIGYTYWQQPPVNVIPKTKKIELVNGSSPGLMVEGCQDVFSPQNDALPQFDVFNKQNYYVELFNKGNKAFKFSAKASEKWLKISSAKGMVIDQEKLYVTIDWEKVPVGKSNGLVKIKAGNENYIIKVNVWNPSVNEQASISGFVESNGYVSFEASEFAKSNSYNNISWMVVPDIGRTGCGVMPSNLVFEKMEPGKGASVEYPVHFTSNGKITVHAYFSPTLNYVEGDGLKYGVSVNDETPQVVNIHTDESLRAWEKAVSNNAVEHKTIHNITSPGNHILKFHMITPGLVLQKIVIDTGGLKPSYLGPQPSFKKF